MKILKVLLNIHDSFIYIVYVEMKKYTYISMYETGGITGSVLY